MPEVIGSDFDRISLENQNGVTLVAASGELDLAIAAKFQGLLQTINGDPTHSPVVVDISETTFMDSAVMTVLYNYAKRSEAENRFFVVDNSSGQERIDRIMGLLGLSDMFWYIRSDLRDLPQAVS